MAQVWMIKGYDINEQYFSTKIELYLDKASEVCRLLENDGNEITFLQKIEPNFVTIALNTLINSPLETYA